MQLLSTHRVDSVAMRLSLFTDYSLRVLMFGALKGEAFSLSEVAGAYAISRNHLVKVVNFYPSSATSTLDAVGEAESSWA
jgi:hypothetical protein